MAVSQSHLLIFTRQFASMLRSGLPLVPALENLARETPQRRLRDVIRGISDDVVRGIDLVDALGRHPRLFGPVFVGVVRSGMEAGRLGDALQQMADYLERVTQVMRKVRGALTYPALVVLVFIAILVGMVTGVLPRFKRMFADRGQDLPAATEFVLAIGDVVRTHGITMLIALACAIALFFGWVTTRDGRLGWDRLKLGLPIVGKLLRLAALSRFARTLAVQVSNSVHYTRALRIAGAAAGNSFVAACAERAAIDVESGHTLADSFRRHTIFGGIIVQMVASGEESGRLEELLLSGAGYFDSLLLQEIETATGMINPALTVGMGLATAGLLIAAFLPVFEMGNMPV